MPENHDLLGQVPMEDERTRRDSDYSLRMAVNLAGLNFRTRGTYPLHACPSGRALFFFRQRGTELLSHNYQGATEKELNSPHARPIGLILARRCGRRFGFAAVRRRNVRITVKRPRSPPMPGLRGPALPPV